jgi:hypothetical protein
VLAVTARHPRIQPITDRGDGTPVFDLPVANGPLR